MGPRRDRCVGSSQRHPRRAGVALLVAALIAAFATTPAPAQLLPEGFFDTVPTPGATAAIEADYLSYDGRTGTISAEGGVIMRYDGYELRGEKLSYNQNTQEVRFVGSVWMQDPTGVVFEVESLEVTGGLKEAFIRSLRLTTPDGAVIEAGDVRYAEELETILTDARYSPCGLCIDSKGRRIGWKVNASKIIYDRDKAVVYLEGPTLELLGVPVAWVPWLVVPDPSQPRAQGFRLPSVDYDEDFGARLNVPYFIPVAEDIDLLLTPSLLSRQGGLMAAEWTHRFPYGEYRIKASGLYQLDPSAFAGTVGDTHWRGAVQTSGTFTPIETWTVGWSYSAFSDAAYLDDYKMPYSTANEIYATHLSSDYYLDVRLRQFLLIGNYTPEQQEDYARAIPAIKGASYTDLGDFGQVEVDARLLGVQRGADNIATYNGVPYILAYEENKAHVEVEANWQNQYVLAGGLVATPYLGLRLDAASYDGASALAPDAVSLLTATPIAALDVRWPLIATSGLDSHLFEPIAQIYYRGSDETLPGITNDDAQSFVFDDTLLFSYNRFSGTDRQETGLRANIGARYLGNFADGRWVQLIAGQSFHLAGPNGLGVIDTAQTGNSTGLEDTVSDFVLGASGSPGEGILVGAKAQVDPHSLAVRRASVAAGLTWDEYSFATSYLYVAANPAIGTIIDQHEVTASVGTPLPFDYWRAEASLSWDIARNSWLEATGRLTYDDGYLAFSGFGTVTGPTHRSPDSTTFGLSFKLKGPHGEFGF